MKFPRRMIAVLSLVCACSAHAQTPDLIISVGVGWDLTLRVGMEYRFHPRFGVRADVGTSVVAFIAGGFGFVADLMGTVYITHPERQFQAGIAAGIPNFIFIAAEGGAAMCSFGATLFAGYRFTDLFALRARAGGGYPVFYEQGRWEIRETRSPLGLWPDFMIEALFHLL